MDIDKPGEPSSPRTSPDASLDLPSLQPLSHDHPLLSGPTFSADTFLLSRLHIPLEELRGELRAYLKVLREELVQLINDDYEEFISLGTGLRGENERLIRLQMPLKGLAEDVAGVRDVLAKHQEEVQAKVNERTTLREERSLLDLLQRLFETLARAEITEDKSVQRVAGEYSQLVYLCEKARGQGCQVVESISPRIASIRNWLSKELARSLLDALDEKEQRQVLKTYESIEGWEEAEEVIRQKFREFCQKTITPAAMIVDSVPKTPSTSTNPFDLLDPSPLATVYNQVLGEVASYRPLLSNAGFDFFAGCLWPEIATAIIDNLGSTIFAAGRPDDLHKHYTTTHRFISTLEAFAPTLESIESMRSSSSYANLERRWQLPVYFQLRWKEIVTTFEAHSPGDGWELGASASAWKALSMCWDENVYISELASRFWRLSLQITTRYETYLKSQIPEGEEEALKFTSAVIIDLAHFAKEVETIDQIKGLESYLAIPVDAFSEKIIEILTRQCTDSLKLVRSVASQLRAAPPKSDITPSYFIPAILKPLHSFYARPEMKSYTNWSPKIIDAVCVSYAGILAGVRKTEDLLRRHRKKKGFSFFTSSQADEGEEERFAKQVQVDIEAFKADAQSFGVDVESLAGWRELVEVVQKPPE